MFKELPITKPYITSYPGIANFLSILQSHPETEGWIFQNFIQVVYYQNINNQYLHEMTGSLLDLESGLWLIGQYSYCPFFSQYILNRDILHQSNSDVISFFKKMIDSDYYVVLYINHQMLSNTPFYQKEDHDNPVMIYGYNDAAEEFLATGYFYHNLYSFHRITYQDFIRAEENVRNSNDYSNDYIQRIQFLHFRPNMEYIFNKEEFLQYLLDYLESKDHTNKLYFITDKKYYYGLSFYDKMAEQFARHSIDERLVQSLFDQKEMMLVRLPFLYKNHYFTRAHMENLIQKTDDVIKKLETIRNVILKNRIIYGESGWPQHLKNELVDAIYTTQKIDYQLTKELYDYLK